MNELSQRVGVELQVVWEQVRRERAADERADFKSMFAPLTLLTPKSRDETALLHQLIDRAMDADAWINYAETGLLPVVVYEYLLDGSLADRRTISMAEIFLDILNKRMTRSEQTRVGEAMRRLGWRKKRIGSRARRRYIYVRRAAFDTCLTP